jgi:hypothetical protein
VALITTGPFQRHFDLAFAGTPDGIFPPKREKPYFDGTLQMTGFDIPVSLRVRGNSSLQECPFPKLKFKVSREHRTGTPFFDARGKTRHALRRGSHGNIGRLRDDDWVSKPDTGHGAGLHLTWVRRASVEILIQPRPATIHGGLADDARERFSVTSVSLNDGRTRWLTKKSRR